MHLNMKHELDREYGCSLWGLQSNLSLLCLGDRGEKGQGGNKMPSLILSSVSM